MVKKTAAINPNITVSKAQKNVWSYICFLYNTNADMPIIGRLLTIKLIKVSLLVVVRNLYPSAMYIIKYTRLKNLEYKNLKNLNEQHDSTDTTRYEYVQPFYDYFQMFRPLSY